jgi:hypothetical protein
MAAWWVGEMEFLKAVGLDVLSAALMVDVKGAYLAVWLVVEKVALKAA